MHTEQAKIIHNQQLTRDFYALDLSAPRIAAAARPGQFVMLGLGPEVEPFLKRPFGVNRIDTHTGNIRLVYRVVGGGTERLSRYQVGQELEVLGPSGQGWQITEAGNILLVGGGTGLAPLLPLAAALKRQGRSFELAMGARTKDDLILVEDFSALGPVKLATDDGSGGQKGLVTQFLPENPSYDQVYCCGPHMMMQRVAEWAQQWGIPCQVSLEERMGCGYGVCMGCVCATKPADGPPPTDQPRYKRVCKEGPVFDSREVVF